MTERAFIALPEVVDLGQAAHDLRNLLLWTDNADISRPFPDTFERYTSDEAEKNLVEAKELCEVGVREQFLIFSGQTAVGMSIVTSSTLMPEGIDPNWPNLSGFICNPHRRQGLGLFSLTERLKVVQKRFGGMAWTAVDLTNVPSQRMVQSAGLERIGQATIDGSAKFLYVYPGPVAR